MTDNPPPGIGGSGEPESGVAPPQPWFPPSGEPGGYIPPPPPPPPGAGQPGPPGQPRWYGPPAGQAPPGGYGYPPPPPGYGPRPYGPWQQQAPKPGVIPLRPLSVGELLDGAFTSIRRNPKATLGIAAVLLTFSAVITTAVSLLLVHFVGSVTLPTAGQTLTTAQATRLLEHFTEVFVPVVALTTVLGFIVDT